MDTLLFTIVIIGAGFLMILLILLITLVGAYNSFIKLRNDLDEAKSSIDVMLKNRHSTIPNLVSAAKEYMRHETEIFDKITKLREQALKSTDDQTKMEYENELSTELSKLSVQINNYPELKANTNIVHLQKSIVTLESKISAARRNFNAAAKAYNNKIDRFPTNLLAMVLSFSRQSYLEFPEASADIDVGNLF